jgi:hypothetical protein
MTIEFIGYVGTRLSTQIHPPRGPVLDYYDLGITTFLIRGFDPLEDAVAYGRELIPLTRELVAARTQSAAAKSPGRVPADVLNGERAG